MLSRRDVMTKILNFTISCHRYLSIPPEIIRKPLVFWCFQGVWKQTSVMKLVNDVRRTASRIGLNILVDININALEYLIAFKKRETLARNGLTHFMPLVSFYTPWEHQKASGFWMFSGVTERDRRHKIG